jgi:hypothetical protein
MRIIIIFRIKIELLYNMFRKKKVTFFIVASIKTGCCQDYSTYIYKFCTFRRLQLSTPVFFWSTNIFVRETLSQYFAWCIKNILCYCWKNGVKHLCTYGNIIIKSTCWARNELVLLNFLLCHCYWGTIIVEENIILKNSFALGQ